MLRIPHSVFKLVKVQSSCENAGKICNALSNLKSMFERDLVFIRRGGKLDKMSARQTVSWL